MGNENYIDEDGLLHIFGDIEATDCLDELKAAAFEVLLLNPGSEFGDWQTELTRNYHTEVVDCYGNDPDEVNHALADLWQSEYDDEASGLCKNFDEWARTFVTEEARDLYYTIVELKGQKR